MDRSSLLLIVLLNSLLVASSQGDVNINRYLKLDVTKYSISEKTEVPISIPTNNDLELTVNHFGGNFPHNTHIVRLNCYGKSPVEWTFNGPHYESIHNFEDVSIRLDKYNETSKNEFNFKSTLNIVVPLPQSTGEYVCRERANIEFRSVYLYMNFGTRPIFFRPGKNYLITDYPYYKDNEFYYITPEEARSTKNFNILSNRLQQTGLKFYKLDTDNREVELQTGANLLDYDSRLGIIMSLGHTQFNTPTPYGTYVVKFHDGTENVFLFNFQLRQSYSVTPTTRFVDQTAGTTTFTCRSGVKIEFSVLGEKLDDTYSPLFTYSEEDKYGVAEINPSKYKYGTKLICKLRGGVVTPPLPPGSPNLKEWLFTRSDEPRALLTYDKTTKKHKCCTRHHYKPLLTTIARNCDNFNECNFAKVQQANTNDYTNGRIVEKTDGNNECVEESIGFGVKEFGSLLIGCSVGPEAYDFKIYSQYEWTMEELDQKITRPVSLRLLSSKDNQNYQIVDKIKVEYGETINFACASEKFFYEQPKMFVEYENGVKKGVEISNQQNVFYKQNWNFYTGSVTFSSDEIVGVSCMAGELNKQEWGIAAVKTEVTGDSSGASGLTYGLYFTIFTTIVTYLRTVA